MAHFVCAWMHHNFLFIVSLFSFVFLKMISLIANNAESFWVCMPTSSFSHKTRQRIVKDWFCRSTWRASLLTEVLLINWYIMHLGILQWDAEMQGKEGVAFGEMGPVLEVHLLGKLTFWVVMFLSGTMKGKVIKSSRNTVCSAGTLHLQVQG